METLMQDLRFALRQLRKSPGFTSTAVLTLALGIAVNATMFSMVSAFLLRRPPGREPSRVAVVTSIDPAGGFQADASAVSIPIYMDWRRSNHVFEDLAAGDEFRTVGMTFQRQSEAIRAAAVSANYFNVLGVNPELGRTFLPGEDQPGQNHVVILSHQLWQNRFNSDPSIVGNIVRINREDCTVIGVMPASFRMTGLLARLWTPLVLSGNQMAPARRDRSLYLFGRLKPGGTLQQARAEFAALASQSATNFPDTEKGWGAAVRTLPDFLVYSFGIRSGLAVIMTTVGFVLLIACANVSGLLLARAAARRRELAIRLSLGAGRFRILRQLLTEGVVIALFGGASGLLLAYWGIRFVHASMNFNEAFSALGLSLDTNVVMFSAAVSMFCAVLCALAPALTGSRLEVMSNLKDEGRTVSAGRSHARLRTVMVTGQIALALLLLVGTGLLFLGIFRIEHQNLGFQSDNLLTAGITLDEARYQDDSQRLAFVRDLLPRLQQIPGAQSAAITSDLPATGAGNVTFHMQGQPETDSNQGRSALDFVVSTDFFLTAGIGLHRGRTFNDLDSQLTPRVVVVNQKFVDRYLHDQDPVGKQIRLDVTGAGADWSQIIGVVGNVRTYSETTAEDPQVFESFSQRPVASFSLVVRASSDPNNLASAVRDTVAQADLEIPLAHLMSMSAVIDRQKSGNPFFVSVLFSFAVLALILSSIGIYGLISYSVGQRANEIGIRMALGAERKDVLRMVLREGAWMAAIGGGIGLCLALPLPRVFGAIFYDLHVSEPRLYLLVLAVIGMISLFATYIPARRASRVEPMMALRQD